MQSINFSNRSILETSPSNERSKGHPYHTIINEKSVLITGKKGYRIFANANIEETGTYDNGMKEWTVNVLSRDNSSSCPVKSLIDMEVRIGEDYMKSFRKESDSINICVYNLPTRQDEKSFSLTIGNDMVILGRVIGWPQEEQRSPSDEYENDNEVFTGSLEILLQLLKQGTVNDCQLKFGCIVLKERIFSSKSDQSLLDDDNWESFE